MLFLEYEKTKRKFHEIKRVYDSILAEKENLFLKTQPRAVDTGKEKVTGSHIGSPFDAYVMELEEKGINERLDEAKALMEQRQSLLSQTEDELRHSEELEDRVYIMRYMERKKVRRISKVIGYSEPQVYRTLKNIREKINLIENDRK